MITSVLTYTAYKLKQSARILCCSFHSVIPVCSDTLFRNGELFQMLLYWG